MFKNPALDRRVAIPVHHGEEMASRPELETFCHDAFRALPSHVCHHLQTPRTAARPSSFRSVPSGLPMTMVKTQKNAAVHANSRMAMLKNGESIRTRIDMPTA